MIGLKPHINAPCLLTYHEGWGTVQWSPSAPVPSFFISGIRGICPARQGFRPCEVAPFLPSCIKAIHTGPSIRPHTISSLSFQVSTVASALQTISSRAVNAPFVKEDQDTMESLARVRNGSFEMDVGLYFETEPPLQIPLFFGEVHH